MESQEVYIHTHENHIKQEKHYFVFTIVTILTLLITLIITLKFNFVGPNLIILLSLIGVLYLSLSFMLLEPKFMKEIFHTVTEPAQEPIIREIIVEKPVIREVDRPIYIDRPVIKEVEKEVIREVEKPVLKEVERPVYIALPKTPLNIPKYEYVGSSQTQVYHTRNCRLGKLIKKKYKITDNSPQYFINSMFSPCQVCIQKIKKI